MANSDDLATIRRMLGDARQLAAADNVFTRVAGERIAVILADVLFEIDVGLPDVVSLLPAQRREAQRPRS